MPSLTLAPLFGSQGVVTVEPFPVPLPQVVVSASRMKVNVEIATMLP